MGGACVRDWPAIIPMERYHQQIVRGRGCEAELSGWDGKAVRAGKSLLCSMLANGVFFGSDARVVWVGCGCSLTRDPAADVTCLPVKAVEQSITHRHARHKPVLQETSVSLFYDFSLCFPLGSPKRNVTLLLPDGNFPSTFQWISEQPHQKRKGPCSGAEPNPWILKSACCNTISCVVDVDGLFEVSFFTLLMFLTVPMCHW